VLPGVDEEAVEAAESCEQNRKRKQRDAEIGTAGDGGNEGGCGEEEADSDLLREAVSAAGGVNENEVPGEQAAEDEIEVDGCGFEMGEKDCERDGGCHDDGKECAAMAIVKVVTGFEVSFCYGPDEAGIEKAIGSVKHPDREKHGNDADGWQEKVIGGGDEPDPERGKGRGVEREQMPESQGRCVGRDSLSR
jgi:hypothetical protein